MNDLPGYDAWKTGPFGRFEIAEERRGERYAEVLSERDSELRTDGELLADAFAGAIDDPVIRQRFASILQAAAGHRPAAQIGDALTRLVNDVIDNEARRFAEEESR